MKGTWKPVLAAFLLGVFMTIVTLLQCGAEMGSQLMAFGARVQGFGSPVYEHTLADTDEMVVMRYDEPAPKLAPGKAAVLPPLPLKAKKGGGK